MVIHEYFDVDLDIVWVVITRHMPKLKKVVARMLETLAWVPRRWKMNSPTYA